MWLLVGLGNPGPAYASTRHNLGAMLIEGMCERLGVRMRRGKGPWFAGDGEVEGNRVTLARPASYMNLSGPAVESLVRQRGVAPAELLVACDDFNLPLGRLRLRPGGGAGGHKGLASIIETLGTTEFPRLRLGMGEPPAGEETADWVLRPFERDERDAVEEMLARAMDVIELVCGESLVRAMDLANRRPEGEGRGGDSVGTSL